MKLMLRLGVLFSIAAIAYGGCRLAYYIGYEKGIATGWCLAQPLGTRC